MSENWIAISIVIVIFLYMVGNFSTVQKNSKTPLRKKGLNDLKETLPRTNKATTEKETMKKKC